MYIYRLYYIRYPPTVHYMHYVRRNQGRIDLNHSLQIEYTRVVDLTLVSI